MYRHIYSLLLIFTLWLFFLSPAFGQDEERVNQLYNQAQSAHEHGDLKRAIELYRETIKLAPDLFEPKYQCAVACLAVGDEKLVAEAVSLLKQVIELKPEFARGHAALGNALARSHEPEAAERELRRALELDAKLPLQARLAELLIARRAFSEAVVQLQTLIDQGKADGQAFLLLGIAEEEQHHLDGALAAYQRALTAPKPATESYYHRGRLYAREKNYPAAIADLKQAYQKSPDNFEIGLALAESYANSGDKKSAIELAQQLVNRPAATEARAALTELLTKLGANDAAIAQLEALHRADPKNADYLARLGELYLESMPGKAVEYWQQAVEIKASAENLTGLASAMLKAQRFEDAIHHFNAALAQNANYYEAHAGLGLALFKLDRFAPAAEQFIWVVKARPDNAIGCFFLGICFDRLGDYRQALSAYELFLRRADPRVNQLEIDKVQLRLPSLRHQAEKQPGKK